jgi:RNA-directed DNA polymerase
MELVASLARPGGNITGMSAPTADGRQRPLGIPALEDKIIQGSVAELLNAICEADFPDCSHGFRPARSPHGAL